MLDRGVLRCCRCLHWVLSSEGVWLHWNELSLLVACLEQPTLVYVGWLSSYFPKLCVCP